MSGPQQNVIRWAVVGLGANLGEPARTFRSAVKLLRNAFDVTAGSRLYAGPALRLPGSGPQPDYVNAAVLLVDVPSTAPQLVAGLLYIERQLGRTRSEQWGPRVVDLDLLLTSEGVSVDPDARVPHPGLHRRAFALRPLLELIPDAHDPVTGASYRSVLDALGPDLLRVVGGVEWASAT